MLDGMEVIPSKDSILPLSAPLSEIPLASRVRSTWLASSFRSVREIGRIDQYLVHLPREYHEHMLSSVPGLWLPIDVAIAHYEACNKLDLSNPQRIDIGIAATRHAHQSIIGVALRAAHASGLTPWAIIPQFHRIWQHAFVGGAVSVHRLGPKEIRLEIVAWPCARVDYCRVATRGVLLGFIQLFCKCAYVHELPERRVVDTMLSFRIAWV